MEELHFSDNFSDLSRQSGADAGFQFEFYCENCNDRWRSAFVPYRSAQASSWLGRAAGLVGGVLGDAGSAVEGLAEAGFGRARDKEFAAAIEQAKIHFHRCAKCHQYVCDVCWNKARGLCGTCAPSAEVEIEAARAQGEIQGATEKAVVEGVERGKRMDVSRDRQLICPACGAHTEGARFCPECGSRMAVKGQCPACKAEIPPDVKFCPECGEKLNG